MIGTGGDDAHAVDALHLPAAVPGQPCSAGGQHVPRLHEPRGEDDDGGALNVRDIAIK